MADLPWGSDPLTYLARIGDEQLCGFDPGIVALAFSAVEKPHISHKRYFEHLDHLARKAECLLQGDHVEAYADALRGSIHKEFGYQGDSETYDDLINADLISVIDRRKGLPVALGIIYMSVCHRLGWEMRGLAFPGHFLVSLNLGSDRLPLDPFGGGRSLSAADMRTILKRIQGEQAELTAECYQTVDDRDVLLRLQNNIKLRRLRNGDLPGALKTVEGMLALAPGVKELRHEIGMIHLRLENISEASRQLEIYLEQETNHGVRLKVATLLQELKLKLN
jgi:regulator of sirC expression with transglutaminase-like and TPR domain